MKTSLPGGSHYLLLISAIALTTTATSQNIDYGKTYFNVTKGVTGGTVEPNDVIEIRATFVVKGGAIADSCGFFDVVPAGTTYIANSLAILTNEGKIYKTFTDAANDDCGKIVGSNVTINLGFNATDNPANAFRRGTVRFSHRPSFYGSTCIMIASYRLRVTAAYGTVINVGGGSATYKIRGTTAPVQTITFNTNRIMVFRNQGICSNTIGGNTLGAEFNGTFGSGKPRNRASSGSVPGSYTYRVFDVNSPQDYYYGIANNTSTRPNYTTSNAWPKPDNSSPTHRVFNVWDIIGDHTGAVNPLLGNTAADTVANPNAGYMLVINASYKTDSAFQHTVTGLCPNTYYEISAWFRNICSRCGCDSAGRGASSAGYIPTAPGDSSGVYPSLTFDVNGSDYYSTGLIKYTGQWIKKGFTYLTGPTETSFTLTVKNNAPGGGGNDWALDDIAVATCTPDLQMKPSPTVNVCYGNDVNMTCDVRCYFDNYVYYEWEKSTDGGLTWNATGINGVGSPAMVSGQWQYTASYPVFKADSGAHNARYRIKIASTTGNLANTGCSFSAASTIQVYVNNCMWVLDTKITSFVGSQQSEKAHLSWMVENESAGTLYHVQKSVDGKTFDDIGEVRGGHAGGGTYWFEDPAKMDAAAYYRIQMHHGDKTIYSKIILLHGQAAGLVVRTTNNPFGDYLTADVHAPVTGKAIVRLFDTYGRQVRWMQEPVNRGLNRIRMESLGHLSAGAYILRVETDGKAIADKVIKR